MRRSKAQRDVDAMERREACGGYQKGTRVHLYIPLDADGPEASGVGRVMRRRHVVDGDVRYFMYDVKMTSGARRKHLGGSRWGMPTPYRKGEVQSALDSEVERSGR